MGFQKVSSLSLRAYVKNWEFAYLLREKAEVIEGYWNADRMLYFFVKRRYINFKLLTSPADMDF
jgi:hypothetical protein